MSSKEWVGTFTTRPTPTSDHECCGSNLRNYDRDDLCRSLFERSRPAPHARTRPPSHLGTGIRCRHSRRRREKLEKAHFVNFVQRDPACCHAFNPLTSLRLNLIRRIPFRLHSYYSGSYRTDRSIGVGLVVRRRPEDWPHGISPRLVLDSTTCAQHGVLYQCHWYKTPC